jgi:hypothetical protein
MDVCARASRTARPYEIWPGRLERTPERKNAPHSHLGKNPLNCDCHLRWLVDYFEANPTLETSEARCELPARSQGKRLSQLNKNELKCQGKCVRPRRRAIGRAGAAVIYQERAPARATNMVLALAWSGALV